MDTPALVSFPLPMLTALLCAVLAGLVWRLDLRLARARLMLSALLALCTLQALLVALRFGYGVTGLIPLQRVLPVFLGPVLYLSFAALAVERPRFARLAALHIGGSVVVLAGFWLTAGDMRHVDWLIGASYLAYIVALWALWRRGPDALIHARVHPPGTVSGWILRGAALLAFILVLDTAIALDFAFRRGAGVPFLISYGAIPLIALLFALLIRVPSMTRRGADRAPAAAAPAEDEARVVARLRAMMEKDRIFLDPDLTVQRLARRLSLPSRDVSGAINRTQGMNVSQYVNGFRLAHAAELLVDSDDSVGRIAEQSGFLTRSNFYREFQRVHGQSPAAYRAERRSPSPQTGG